MLHTCGHDASTGTGSVALHCSPPSCLKKLHPNHRVLLYSTLSAPLFVMAGSEEELQSLYDADDDDNDAPPRARCSKSCTAGIVLLPLPCASEIRISVSPSTPTRRRKFLLALAAGNPTQLAARNGTCSNLLTLPRLSACRVSDVAVHQEQKALLCPFQLDARLQREVHPQRTAPLQRAHRLLHGKQPRPVLFWTNGLGPIEV